MSNVQAAKDDIRPPNSTFSGRRTRKPNNGKNWHWYDPPILFPIGLILLIAGYALLRAPL